MGDYIIEIMEDFKMHEIVYKIYLDMKELKKWIGPNIYIYKIRSIFDTNYNIFI